jgi:hypothetical protein
MNNLALELENHLQGLVSAMQQAQLQRVRVQWLPQVVDALTAAPAACLDLLRQGLSGRQDTPTALPEELAKACARTMARCATRTKSVLADMVRHEAVATAAIITLDGTMGRRLDLEALVKKLAGAGAVDQSIKRWFLEFVRRAEAALGQAQASQRVQGLDEAARIWRGRLKTIAVTVAMAVANRTKREVSGQLNHHQR